MTVQYHGLIMKRVRSCAMRFLRAVVPLVFLLQAAACASTTAHHEKAISSQTESKRVVLRPGDEIELKFPYWQELNDTQVIRPDGFINLQLIDAVQTQGLTPEELDEKLTKLYESKIKDPVISVVVRSLVDQRIYVGGEVNIPGLQTLQGEVNVLQAIINAGGFKETAKMANVIIIRKDKEGRAVPYSTNLSRTIYNPDMKETFLLQPNDVVYVPKTAIANLNKFVDQYIAKLFLFRGIGLGFTYRLDDNGRDDSFININ